MDLVEQNVFPSGQTDRIATIGSRDLRSTLEEN